MFILILELTAIPWNSTQLINEDFKFWGNSLQVGDSRILTNGDVKEGDIMEGVNEAMVNLVEDLKMEYSTYGNPSQ